MIFHLQGVWVEDQLGGRSCVDRQSVRGVLLPSMQGRTVAQRYKEVTRKVFAERLDVGTRREKTIQNDPWVLALEMELSSSDRNA